MPVTHEPSPYPGFAARAKSVFTTWLENPSQVASVVPSSSALTEAISERSCIREAGFVVDLGPGTGETTKALLENMHRHSTLLAIEKTEEFVGALRKIDDSRLVVSQGDALHLAQFLGHLDREQADVIVSGIPFSALPAHDAQSIIRSVHQALVPGGQFIAYQFLNSIEGYAKLCFDKPEVMRVWRNLPPLRIYTWVKAS